MNQTNNNQRNFLIEFEEKGYDLIQFETYHNFLIECSQKDYNEIGTHEHHILPKGFMEGSDKKQNLIQLSYQDHYTAHLILAECFQKGDKNRGYNYASAKLIVGWVKQYLSKRYEDISEQWEGFWDLAHKEVSELNRGENHPQYGDKYSPEKCKEMSDRMKGKMIGELNPFYGKRHTEETKAIIREKRALQVITEESKEKRRKTQSGSGNHFYGKTHTDETKESIRISLEKYRNTDQFKNRINKGFVIQDVDSDIIYYSMKDMNHKTGLTINKIKKLIALGKLVIIENASHWK